MTAVVVVVKEGVDGEEERVSNVCLTRVFTVGCTALSEKATAWPGWAPESLSRSFAHGSAHGRQQHGTASNVHTLTLVHHSPSHPLHSRPSAPFDTDNAAQLLQVGRSRGNAVCRDVLM